MKDLQRIGYNCIHKLQTLEIPYSQMPRFILEYRLDKLPGWAELRARQDGFDIVVVPTLLDDDLPLEYLEEVLIHELLHTCPHSLKHSSAWLKFAQKVQRAYKYPLTVDKEPCPEFKTKDICHLEETPILIQPGFFVKHTVFGSGLVISAEHIGSDVLYEILWRDGTKRKILQSTAVSKLYRESKFKMM